jgi:uncharacterized membrane protein YvbJ
VQCRNCGTEIADKALICYKCGTATTEAKYQPAPLRRARAASSRTLLLVVVAVIIAALVAYYLLTGVP